MGTRDIAHRAGYWLGAASTGPRRSFAVLPLLILGLLAWAAGTDWLGGSDVSLLFVVLLLGVVGMLARSWLVVPLAWGATVLLFSSIEIGTFLWLGAAEWEERNIEHMPGNDPAWWKLTGQLVEYVVLSGLFMLPFIAVGVGLGKWLAHRSWERRYQEPAGM